jgi:hypothetical protein
MAQQNLAFIMGHTRGGGGLEAALIAQIERYAQLGRKNVVVVMDTFPSLEGKTMAALQQLLRRASELGARVTCVAVDDRVVSILRSALCEDDVRIIRRVDQIPGAAA